MNINEYSEQDKVKLRKVMISTIERECGKLDSIDWDKVSLEDIEKLDKRMIL